MVWCMFEQSGTFKNEFKKLGMEAVDLDILNDFGETDCVMDLFKEIENAYDGKQSVFDNIEKDDLIFAFFPCTKFETLHYMNAKGNAVWAKNKGMKEKLEYSMKAVRETYDFYVVLCKFVSVCVDRNIRLVIENPCTNRHFMTDFFPMNPAVVHKDRTEWGDTKTKPTQYWFVNFEPMQNFVFENSQYCGQRELVMHRIRHRGGVETRDVGVGAGKSQKERQVLKSMISKEYANRFIREYIQGYEK